MFLQLKVNSLNNYPVFFKCFSSVEEVDGTKHIAGVDGVYTHVEPDMEHLVIYGPLKKSIQLYVCT